MKVLVINLCFLVLTSAASTPSESEKDGCPGYTVNNYNYGSSDGFVVDPRINQEHVKQGRPGKSGARGFKGEKGQKGAPADDISAHLRSLGRDVQDLQSITRPVLHAPPSCAHVDDTVKVSGTYLISPQPQQVFPYFVYCDFINGTKTIVEHDSIAEIEASKCRGARCYKRVIRYNVDLKQIAALIQVSQSCRQFIKYRCGGSVLLYGSATDYGSWVSRNGTRMKYWGGAASRRDNYCACGETGTCVESDQLCNCDKNNLPETSDEGYITDPDALPVTQLQFGDTDGSGEYGFHTLGALECTGRRSE